MTKKCTPLPDDDALNAFITASPRPPTLREIAKAFGLAPQQRAELRARLHRLASDNTAAHVNETSKRPAISLLQIISIDHDGYAQARFADADMPESPKITLLPSNKSGKAVQHGDRVLARLKEDQDEQSYEAELIRILPKGQSRIFGQASNISRTAQPRWVLLQAEKGGKRNIPIRNKTNLTFSEDDLLEAELVKENGYHLVAHPLRNLGSINSPDAFTTLAIAEFDLRHIFTKEMNDAAAAVSLPELGKRKDLRATPLVTIDGEDAKDFDDAVFAEPAPENCWRIIVAIADVSTYVQSGDILDHEARKRGNSVYLPGTVIPMLPEALSNGLCSLRPNEDRACLAVEIIIDSSGNKLSHKFFQAMIKSSARLTYTMVQQVIEGSLDEADCRVKPSTLHHLIGAYRNLREARNRRGTLNLNLSEAKIQFDKTGQPESVAQKHQEEAHQLIEEFMITANICAAETLEQAGESCVYRIHDQPDPEKINSLRELTDVLALPFAKGQAMTPHKFNELLIKVKDTDSETAVNEAILRCQSRAVYSPDNIGHYGLGLTRYAHFTSPIRRYSDLLVHRSLIRVLTDNKDGRSSASREKLGEICAAISQTEQTAAKAERRATTRLAAKILSHKTITEFEVIITGLTKSGLFVKLDDGASEGFIPRRTLPDDFYEIVAGGMMLLGRHHGWLFRLGDKLICHLEDIRPASGDITLSWISGGLHKAETARDLQKKFKSRPKGRNKLAGWRRR
ncbi:MAG: ribonuclease R [Rhodospirillaceae bacterium]|nr:ribonuclease R [Rhodospirillaceae bacterium]